MEPVPLVAVHFLSNQGFSAAADATIMALHPEHVKRCAVFDDVLGPVVVYVFPSEHSERFLTACAERGLSAMRGVLARHIAPRQLAKSFDIGSAVVSLAGPGAVADDVFVVTAALPFAPPK